MQKYGKIDALSIAMNERYRKLISDAGLTVSQVLEHFEAIADTSVLDSDSLKAFDLTDQKESIDAFQSVIEKVQSSLEKLKSGNLSQSDITDLLQEFPTLIPYVDDLETGLNQLANTTLRDLVKSFEDMRNDENSDYIDHMISMFSDMAEQTDKGC